MEYVFPWESCFPGFVAHVTWHKTLLKIKAGSKITVKFSSRMLMKLFVFPHTVEGD